MRRCHVSTAGSDGPARRPHWGWLPHPNLHAALSSEQKALVDFLVLARGARFVGFGSSTFSYFLREFRVLAGTPRSASLLANASAIGTDPIFASAGTVA